MKTFGIIVFLTIICLVSTEESEVECECTSSWVSWRIGRRQPGDQLLFRDVKSSNWTVPRAHEITFAYENTNITLWEIGMAPVRKNIENMDINHETKFF